MAGQALIERLFTAVAVRPAAPGLVLVAGLLVAAGSGWTVTDVAWFWPACTATIVLAVLLNTAHQDVWRRVHSHEHRQRMNTANALLNDHPPIRELGGLVEKFGHKLDDLLAEVDAERATAGHRPHRSSGEPA